MKHNLTPEQVRILALVLAGILGGAGAGWWGMSQLGEAQNEAQMLADRLGKPGLGAILQRADGIEGAERELKQMEKVQMEMEKLKGESVANWEKATLEADGSGQEWSREPGKWKDELIERQNRLVKKSSSQSPNARVEFDSNFYLGLQAYRQKSPTPEELPRLVRELSLATRLVEMLMDSRSVREDYPTVCVLTSLAGPSTQGEKTPESPVETKKEIVWMFEISLEASPEVLFEFVRRISLDPWPFLIRNLEIRNELPNFPTRSEIRQNLGQSQTTEGSEAGAKAATAKKLLLVLAGKEKLNVKMTVEFVPWPLMAPPAMVPAS